MAGWINSTGSGGGGGGGRGSGGRGFTAPRYTDYSTFDMNHGGTSGGGSGGGGSGRWRGGRSRGRPPPQPHYRYRRVDAVHRDSPPASLSEQQVAPSTSSRHRYLTRSISAADKSSASGAVGSTDTREPDDKATRSAANFECNVCFDMAAEPVVTKCGHLFCWECLYQWLHVHSHHRECPVCKGQVADDAIIPIYGRGGSAASVDNAPPRPAGARVESSRQQEEEELRQQVEFVPIVDHHSVLELLGSFTSRRRRLPPLPTFLHPTVFDDDDGHDWDMRLLNEGIDPFNLMPPGTQDIEMEDYDDTIDFDDDYEFDYHSMGATWLASAETEASNPSSSQARAGMINIRDNIVDTTAGVYHQQEFGYSGARPQNNRGRRGRRNRARASANHSSADEFVHGDTSHFYFQNGGSSNFSAGAAFRPNGGWTERRGRSNLSSNSGGGRGGMQGSRRQRTNDH